MSKYTDEQLSRILGECAAGHLVPGGHVWPNHRRGCLVYYDGRGYEVSDGCACAYYGCINQAAYNVEDASDAARCNSAAAEWFDALPMPIMLSPDELLHALEGKGFA